MSDCQMSISVPTNTYVPSLNIPVVKFQEHNPAKVLYLIILHMFNLMNYIHNEYYSS